MVRTFHLPGPRALTFWHFQIAGWSLMYAADLILISLHPSTLIEFLVESLETPIAFLLSLVLREIYKRLDYRRLSMVGLIAYVGFWSLVFTIIWYSLITIMFATALGARYSLPLLNYRIAFQWINYLGAIWLGWSALYFGLKFWRDWDTERERARKAASLAQRAQLEMLRYQLNPHFLFNALNSVRALVDEDRGLAKGMITELSEFLRYSLVHPDRTEVPLREELAAIQHYLTIEQRRFEDKLQVQFEITPEAESFRVLSFLLHPLVENAVKYGMKTSPMPLRLRVRAAIVDDALQLSVRNSGSWAERTGAAGRASGTGTGLENVRARLENAYPHRHSFGVSHSDDAVEVSLELRPATAL